jgi:branched-chain amino acid aminotransferase
MTPALSEGCVNGVMRRWLMERYKVKETFFSIDDVLTADELFFTNAMYGIRWVKQFRDKMYSNLKASKMHDELLNELWK